MRHRPAPPAFLPARAQRAAEERCAQLAMALAPCRASLTGRRASCRFASKRAQALLLPLTERVQCLSHRPFCEVCGPQPWFVRPVLTARALRAFSRCFLAPSHAWTIPAPQSPSLAGDADPKQFKAANIDRLHRDTDTINQLLHLTTPLLTSTTKGRHGLAVTIYIALALTIRCL